MFAVHIKEKKNNKISIGYIITLVSSALITLFVSMHIAGLAIVCGVSMQPTLDSGNILLVNKLTKNYERFDVVIIKTSHETIIKRIIALPGDTIQIKNGCVYVNNEQIVDVVNERTEFEGIAIEPLTLGEDEYFVLGDNRAESMDSRYAEIGTIKHNQIVGLAFFSLIPIKNI